MPHALRVIRLALFALAFVPPALAAQANSGAPPDIVLLGGKVFTADSARPWAEAVAIRGNRIVGVGTTAEIGALAGPRTRRVELEGRTVVPGINDAHVHIGPPRRGTFFSADPAPTPDPEPGALLDSIRTVARRAPLGSWIFASVTGYEPFSASTQPSSLRTRW